MLLTAICWHCTIILKAECRNVFLVPTHPGCPRHSHKKFPGNRPRVSSKRRQNMLYIFFCHQYNAAIWIHAAMIWTMFETADINQCAGAYTCEKFMNFCKGVLQAPKKLPREAVFWAGCLLPAHSSDSTISGDTNHFWGLADIPRMCLLYVSFDRGCTVWALWLQNTCISS